MSYFAWGTIAVFASTIIFYAVFASLVYYWHEKMTTVLIVPLIYTFEFFMIASLVGLTLAFALEYLPNIAELLIFIVDFIFGFGKLYSSSS